MKFLFSFYLLALSLNKISALDSISCKNITTFTWWNYIGDELTCYVDTMSKTTSLDVSFVYKPDEKIDSKMVGAINFQHNKNVVFLPGKMNNILPNLVVYDAGVCSITLITKRNFEKLTKLREINLEGNKITVIDQDVFEDLISLESIYLHNNEIKYINSRAFLQPKLGRLSLRYNKCMSKDYESVAEKITIKDDITQNCELKYFSFQIIETNRLRGERDECFKNKTIELKEKTSIYESTISGMNKKIINLTEENQKAVAKIENKTVELKEKISMYESLISERNQKLANLIEENQNAQAEIVDHKDKIRRLEEKVDILSNNDA